ncbi:hypothetical protein [Streptomyces sp. NPDC016845]|uniref:hypothetical protein n=1 Tax=Streptomyces sp. NPDC016845 TaxID=3364972 RepID=UPI0037B2566B
MSAAAAAVVLGAAPATADPGDVGGAPGDSRRTVSVAPAAVRAGSDVELRVGGCDGATGRARSDAFAAPGVLGPAADGAALSSGRPTLFTEARVRSTVAPGTYRIQVTCGETRASEHAEDVQADEVRAEGVLRVVAEGGAPAPAPTPTALVHAGGGGAATRLAAHDDSPRAALSDGPGTRHAVIGLVLTAIAAVAVAFRTVRRRRMPQPPRSPR